MLPKFLCLKLFEASYFDRINMTENPLEFDKKINTDKRWNMTTNSHWWTLIIEHDQIRDELDWK